MSGEEQVVQASAVAIRGRGVMLLGKPGSGKSTLALALIDRGAQLVGDDGVQLSRDDDRVLAAPPPNIAGKLEIRGIGIVELEAVSAPLALILDLDSEPERMPQTPIATREYLGHAIPCLPFDARGSEPALRAEWALHLHGLPG